jgi:AbiV family abortive infection protein
MAESRFARALSLTVLALEELAKPPLLWELDPSADAKEWRTFWREQFSRHSPKQQAIGQYGFLTALGECQKWGQRTISLTAKIPVSRVA